mgnify:CR=1 FL=1
MEKATLISIIFFPFFLLVSNKIVSVEKYYLNKISKNEKIHCLDDQFGKNKTLLKTLKKLCLWKDCLWMHSLFFFGCLVIADVYVSKMMARKKNTILSSRLDGGCSNERCLNMNIVYTKVEQLEPDKINSKYRRKKSFFFCLKNHVKISRGIFSLLKFIELVIHKVNFFVFLFLIRNDK